MTTKLDNLMKNIKHNSEQINQLTQGMILANIAQDHKSLLMLSAVSMQILTEGHNNIHEAKRELTMHGPESYAQLCYLNTLLDENSEAIKHHTAILQEIQNH